MAMSSLGYLYCIGIGTDQNGTKAFECFEKSANLGCCHGMNNLGKCYSDSIGVAQDLIKAKE